MSTYAYSNNNIRKDKGRLDVHSDDGSRKICWIKEGVFYKYNFDVNKHVHRNFKAIGIDEGAFLNTIQLNAGEIICEDRHAGLRYVISVASFKANGFISDLKFGRQLFCPLKWWTVEKRGQETQLSFAGMV